MKAKFLILGLLLILCLGSFLFQKTIKENDLQIGQMLIIGFRGTEINEIKKAIKEVGVGGVVLFDYDVPSKTYGRNILNKEQVKKLISDLKKCSPNLFIGVDAEGGKVNRLQSFFEMPSHQDLAETDNIEEKVSQLTSLLKELGFNMNFAPVLDLNINKENPIIGKLGRSFSENPFKVAALAERFIESQKGIISVVKHFPGHGSAVSDSHLGLADVTNYYREEELIPYKYLQEKGLLRAVMTAHIVNRNIDSKFPSTMSSLFLEDILRKQIGFQGIIISDDIQMKALTNFYTLEDIVVHSINAGCDMLILSNNVSEYDEHLPFKVRDIILNAVKQGKISEQRIEQALERIKEIKGLL